VSADRARQDWIFDASHGPVAPEPHKWAILRLAPRLGTPRNTGRMIGFLVAGLIIGALARLFKPGRQNLGLLATLGLGLVGSLIGGTIAWLLGTGSIWELNVIGFVLSVIAAVLLVGTAEAVTGKNRAIR
jgi:uncharacterized membrane protein YeaQ/YmgE (transglycosylase-associated protein family)